MARFTVCLVLFACLTSCSSGLSSVTTSAMSDIGDADITADRDNSKNVAMVSTAFNEAMLKCPEKVWPDYDWRALEVILFDSVKQQAFRWNGSDGAKAEMISFSSVDPRLVQGVYAYNLPGEKPLMSLSLNSESSLYGLIGLGIHEAFHKFGQVGWLSLQLGVDDRFTPYPQNYRARYLRYAISRLLLGYLDTGDRARLSEVRGVWDRYRREFKGESESIALTDIEEGTARFVEVMGTALGALGCAADDATLYARFRAYLLKTEGGFLHISFPSGESYLIGALASLALHNDMAHKGWEKRTAVGDTPLAILLENVSPKAAPEFSDMLMTAKSTIETWNEETKPRVEIFKESAISDEYYAFAIPENRRMGSYNATGQIKDVATGWQLVTDINVSFSARQSTALIKLNGLTIRTDGNSLCSANKQNMFLFYLPRNQVKIEGEQQLSFSGGAVTGDRVAYQEVRDKRGNRWFCL